MVQEQNDAGVLIEKRKKLSKDLPVGIKKNLTPVRAHEKTSNGSSLKAIVAVNIDGCSQQRDGPSDDTVREPQRQT